MNRHGFTLVEMLATIVILSIVLGIASYGIINVIKSSQKKSEKIFVERVGGLVDDYVGLDLKLDQGITICLTGDSCEDGHRCSRQQRFGEQRQDRTAAIHLPHR